MCDPPTRCFRSLMPLHATVSFAHRLSKRLSGSFNHLSFKLSSSVPCFVPPRTSRPTVIELVSRCCWLTAHLNAPSTTFFWSFEQTSFRSLYLMSGGRKRASLTVDTSLTPRAKPQRTGSPYSSSLTPASGGGQASHTPSRAETPSSAGSPVFTPWGQRSPPSSYAFQRKAQRSAVSHYVTFVSGNSAYNCFSRPWVNTLRAMPSGHCSSPRTFIPFVRSLFLENSHI